MIFWIDLSCSIGFPPAQPIYDLEVHNGKYSSDGKTHNWPLITYRYFNYNLAVFTIFSRYAVICDNRFHCIYVLYYSFTSILNPAKYRWAKLAPLYLYWKLELFGQTFFWEIICNSYFVIVDFYLFVVV